MRLPNAEIWEAWSCYLWLLVAATCASAEHHVGTPAELTAAIRESQPGDVIRMRSGTWDDLEILFEAAGTTDRPITLCADQAGKTIISGESRLRISGEHLVVEGLYFKQAFHKDDLISFRKDSKKHAHHCRLTNCAVVDCNGPPPDSLNPDSGRSAFSNRWVSLYGEHNRVDHCWLEGKTTVGTTLVVWLGAAPNHHRIDHNYFGPRPELKKNGGETIRVGDSATSLRRSLTIVESNRFHECNGEAEIISNKSCGNVYRFNVFVRCSGALTLRHGNDCQVHANVFLGEGARGTGGVRIIGEGHRVWNNYFADLAGTDARAALSIVNGLRDSPLSGYATAKNCFIGFNTLVHCRQSFVIGLSDSDEGNDLPPEDCRIENNLVLLKSGRTAIDQRMDPVRLIIDGNLVRGSDENLPAGFRSTNVAASRDDNRIWRLAEPIEVTGRATPAFVEADFDGQPRGDRKHIGCDQHSAESRAPLALSARCGVDWHDLPSLK